MAAEKQSIKRVDHQAQILFGVVMLTVLAIYLAPYLAPFSPKLTQLEHALQTPNALHLLGTDANGKDILSLILHGARLSLTLSLVVVLICTGLGLVIGFIAAYFGRTADRIFLFVADVFQAFPGILLAIGVAAFIKPSVGNLILLLSFVGWVSYARVVRAQVLEIKTREFVQAARAIGVPLPLMLARYFLPNMAGPLVVQASFGMAGVILAESTLSFLGLGLPVSVPSLGKLLDSGVGLLMVAPHVSLFPGAVIMIFVLLFNLVGDRLREIYVGR